MDDIDSEQSADELITRFIEGHTQDKKQSDYTIIDRYEINLL